MAQEVESEWQVSHFDIFICVAMYSVLCGEARRSTAEHDGAQRSTSDVVSACATFVPGIMVLVEPKFYTRLDSPRFGKHEKLSRTLLLVQPHTAGFVVMCASITELRTDLIRHAGAARAVPKTNRFSAALTFF